MLNLYAATGHGNYAKSARLYLQEMMRLPETHPWLYALFFKGHHTVKRSQNIFAAVWTDLCIEQSLMCSIKSPGGLTQGRGLSENFRTLWVLSMSSSAKVHGAIVEVTGTQMYSTRQHIELGTSRRKLDFADCRKLYDWLKQRHPFLITSENLHSLSTGLVSIKDKDDVSCERAEEVGKLIQSTFDNQPFSKCTVWCKEIIKPLSILHHLSKVKKTLSHLEYESDLCLFAW